MDRARGREENITKPHTKNRLYFSILLTLLALVSVTAASVAWFTIADFTKVHSMSMQITTGTNLRFDIDPHETFDQYVKTLSFAQIAGRIVDTQGYDPRVKPLEPVTTTDYRVYTFEHGDVVESSSGAYMEFVLHFMATKDMLVHLTSENSEGAVDGTRVTSSNPALPQAMRISFTADESTYVYSPGAGDTSTDTGMAKVFGLPAAENMVMSDNNAMFWLEQDVDKPVTVRIWLEGTDPACTDALRNGDYSISLRFMGTDAEHHVLQ